MSGNGKVFVNTLRLAAISSEVYGSLVCTVLQLSPTFLSAVIELIPAVVVRTIRIVPLSDVSGWKPLTPGKLVETPGSPNPGLKTNMP